MQMDHHCGFVNNCIGIRNQKAFLLFTFYTVLVCLMIYVRAILLIWQCWGNEDLKICPKMVGFKWFIGGAIFFSLISMVFAGYMLMDTVKMIPKKLGKIDTI
jgi:hypothetical protein